MSARIIGSIAFGLLACVTACSGTTTGGGTSGSSSGSSGSTSTSGGPTNPGGGSARQACLDTADVVATAFTRCGGTYQENYDAFLKSAANGSCNNVVGIRDESSLRGACFRYFQNATCAQLETFDASCKGQLTVQTNTFEPELAPASGKAEGWVGVGAE